MKNSILLIGGIVLFAAGVVITVLGKMVGILVLFAGFALIAFYGAMMLRTGGYRTEDAFFNGLFGQGRQQSETGKMPQSGSGEQPTNIWDMVKDGNKNQ